MAKFNKNGVEITPRDLKQFDIYLAQPGAGRGLLKGAGILSITIVLCAGAWYGTKKFLGKSGSSSNEKKNPSPVASKAGASPVDTPYEEVPTAPIENPLAVEYEDLGELAADPNNRVHRLMGNWLKQGEVTLVCGNNGAGKSALATQMAIELALGWNRSELFDCPVPQQQRCIYVSYEMTRAQWGERYKDAVDTIGGAVQMVFPDIVKFPLTEGALKLCRSIYMGEHESGTKHLTVIIDNHTQFAKNPGNTTSKECQTLVKGLQELMREYEGKGMVSTILLLAHTTKDGKKVRGSSVLTNMLDTVIFIEKVNEDLRLITAPRNRSTESPEGFLSRLEEAPYLHFKRVTREEMTEEMEDVMEKAQKSVDEFVESWKKEAQDAEYCEVSDGEEEATDKTLPEKGTLLLDAVETGSNKPEHVNRHEWSTPPEGGEWRELDRAEQVALYHIIIREHLRKENNKAIADKIKARFNIKVQESKIGDFVKAYEDKGLVPPHEVTNNRGKEDIKNILRDYFPDGEEYIASLFG